MQRALNGTVHLVRHGEVENPKGVIYGRLPGYNLSERGLRQARQSAVHLEVRDVAAVWASPLERAQETAAEIAASHRLEVITDDRLIESGTKLEGVGKTFMHFLRAPKHWWRLRNPMKPSWGESFSEVRTRMLEVIEEGLVAAEGREVVFVSHQTPVLVARLALMRRAVPPWLGGEPCTTGSVATLRLENGRVVESGYYAPPG